MLYTVQKNISKLELAIQNVSEDAVKQIYKEDILKPLLEKVKSQITIESVDNVEQCESINIHAQVCLLSKKELYEIFDRLERLKKASNKIPGHLIDEIKEILV